MVGLSKGESSQELGTYLDNPFVAGLKTSSVLTGVIITVKSLHCYKMIALVDLFVNSGLV